MGEQFVAIVTAAGSGTGVACARKLAFQGFKLVLMSRPGSAAAIATELGGASVQGSVTVEEDLRKVVELALESFGRINAVVNNTGHASGESELTGRRYDPAAASHLLDILDEDWHRNFDLFFLYVVRMARLVTLPMQQQGGGAILNISAFAAFEASYAFSASATIRPALSGFTKLYAD